jgi:hypothetical protein
VRGLFDLLVSGLALWKGRPVTSMGGILSSVLWTIRAGTSIFVMSSAYQVGITRQGELSAALDAWVAG